MIFHLPQYMLNIIVSRTMEQFNACKFWFNNIVTAMYATYTNDTSGYRFLCLRLQKNDIDISVELFCKDKLKLVPTK